jgi:hypothetical protein
LQLVSIYFLPNDESAQEVGMLKGFTVPKSLFGQAALTPPPPWRYSRGLGLFISVIAPGETRPLHDSYQTARQYPILRGES